MRPKNHRLTVLSLLPFAMMAAVTVADLAVGPAVVFLPLVSLGPAFAPLMGSWRRTACIGGIALFLCVGLGWYNNLLDGSRGLMSITTVLGVTAGIRPAPSGANDGRACHRSRGDHLVDGCGAGAQPARRVASVGRDLAIAVCHDAADVPDHRAGGLAVAGPAAGRRPPAAAMLLGAVLAPTDPVLAAEVRVGEPRDDALSPVRQA
ncbi:hypothetical protein [Streptomyces violaceus]|uniref:hypothetical protein n=1 Tax=Streptomyces violaceus TaxID=1936 RepID=UPI002E1D2D2B